MGGSPGGQNGQGSSTVVTPTTAAIVPTVTPSIQPIQQKDTTWTKLFVGGLPYHTTDKSLRDHFEVYGDIEEAVVITDRSTGKSRGYGFVIMATKDAAERACKEPNPIIDGRKANVNLAILGAKPRGNLTAPLTLAALRPGYPAIMPGQYGDLTGLASQLGLSPGLGTASPGQAQYMTALQAVTAGTQQPQIAAGAAVSGNSAPGKARSSMNLGLISGRQHMQPGAANPYLQQLYAAAAPYSLASPNIMQLMGGMGAGQVQSSGNPLLDMYAGQYMSQIQAAQGYQVSQGQQVVPVTQSPEGINQSPGQPHIAGGYLGYAYAPLTAQQLSAATAQQLQGLPAAAAYAAAAGPTAASVQSQQQSQQETRIQ